VVLLGVDGGGTTTHVLVAGPDGSLLGAAVGAASNWENVGIVGAGEALRAAVLEALDEAHGSAGEVEAAVFGLAGLDWGEDRRRLMIVPDSLRFAGPSDVVNDAFVALRAGSTRPLGVVVVGGTGSIAAGRNADGETFRTFGLGRTFGDCGGAQEISEDAVRAVAESWLGKGPPTALAGTMCRSAGVDGVPRLLEELSRGRIDPGSFLPEVVRAADAGDAVARLLLDRAGGELAGSAATVIRRLAMEDEVFEVVLSGAVLRSSHLVRERLTAELGSVAPRASSALLGTMPVVGSVLLAMELAGLEPSPEVHARLAGSAMQRFHPAMSEPA
jgi:N-acetylglucosamine kinase-like BadF-type ATPase